MMQKENANSLLNLHGGIVYSIDYYHFKHTAV